MPMPYALPAGPTRRAESKTSIPPPEPRSSTVSPGFNVARAVGLPQPNDALRASSGICVAWSSSYRRDVMGSGLSPHDVVLQQERPPLRTRNAASPYFSLTASLMSVPIIVPLLLATNNRLGFHDVVSGAALRIKKTK